MSTADFFEVLKTRRSVRVYKPDAVPAEVVKKVVENGFLAPNSSNMQTCQVHWVKTPEKKLNWLKPASIKVQPVQLPNFWWSHQTEVYGNGVSKKL